VKTEDRLDYVQRYEKRLQEFGYSPATLGWGVNGRQEVRFSILAEAALRMPESSVLDVGCGFCDLYDFLDKRGWQGRYTGIDIVPGLLEVARRRHPSLDVRELDITDESAPLDEYDFVISSGALNATLPSGSNETHIEVALRSMYQRSRRATCVDFLSTYVDFQKPGAYHTDPGWALAAAKRLTRRVLLRHDYMAYEFSLLLFRDDAISERKVFRAFEDELATGI
jgi:SAM-dependent methyltransferase